MLFSAMLFGFINAGLKSNRIYSDSTLAASLGPFEIPRRNRVFSSLGTTIGQSYQRGSLAGQRLSRHKVLILKSAEPRQNTMTFNTVDLYRVAAGAKEILAHSTSKLTPKGRDRTRKKPIQLKLEIFDSDE